MATAEVCRHRGSRDENRRNIGRLLAACASALVGVALKLVSDAS